MGSRAVAGALLLILLLVLPALLGAAPAQGREPEAFLPYLFAVYAITWAAFFAYAFFVSRKQEELRREVEALRRSLEERDRAQAGKGKPPGA
jgi:CcmD family protein